MNGVEVKTPAVSFFSVLPISKATLIVSKKDKTDHICTKSEGVVFPIFLVKAQMIQPDRSGKERIHSIFKVEMKAPVDTIKRVSDELSLRKTHHTTFACLEKTTIPPSFPISEIYSISEIVKFVVFAPLSAEMIGETMIKVLGVGSNILSCKGKARYIPGEGSDPAIGSIGKSEIVEELKYTTWVSIHRLSTLIKAIEEVHPYEEVGIDLIPNGKNGDLGWLENVVKVMQISDAYCNMVKVNLLTSQKKTDDLREIMGKAGIGAIGNYFNCSFSTPGTLKYPSKKDFKAIVLKKGESIESVAPPDALKRLVEDLSCDQRYKKTKIEAFPLLSLPKKRHREAD